MKKIIRFLTNFYEMTICILFILSIVQYVIGVLWLCFGLIITFSDTETIAFGFLGFVAGFIFLTAWEFFIIIVLGTASILIDIRNELRDTRNQNYEN